MNGAIRFTAKHAARAHEAWGFNCGPAALCAVLGKTPEELRPALLDFEDKRYSNPTLICAVLHGLRVPHRTIFRADEPVAAPVYPEWGLVRIQWGGRWTKPGVPLRARYPHTHWIAMRGKPGREEVFDVNTTASGWITFARWREVLGTWLLGSGGPHSDGADGTWWPTHSLEVTPPGASVAGEGGGR